MSAAQMMHDHELATRITDGPQGLEGIEEAVRKAFDRDLDRARAAREQDEALLRELNERILSAEEHVPRKPASPAPMSVAPAICHEAAATIGERGAQRDSVRKEERSMARCVATFNGLTGRDLTEQEGWFFMVALKMARAMNGKTPRRDDYVDLAAYGALAGESVLPLPKDTYATEQPSP